MTPDFTLKRGDVRPSLQATLTDSVGAAVILDAGSTARFNMRQRAGSNVITGPAIIESLGNAGPPTTGAVLRYDWQAGDTIITGLYDAEFEVDLGGTGNLETFPNDRDLLISIRRDVA